MCVGGKSANSIPPALGPEGSTEVSKFKGTCTLPLPPLCHVQRSIIEVAGKDTALNLSHVCKQQNRLVAFSKELVMSMHLLHAEEIRLDKTLRQNVPYSLQVILLHTSFLPNLR